MTNSSIKVAFRECPSFNRENREPFEAWQHFKRLRDCGVACIGFDKNKSSRPVEWVAQYEDGEIRRTTRANVKRLAAFKEKQEAGGALTYQKKLLLELIRYHCEIDVYRLCARFWLILNGKEVNIYSRRRNYLYAMRFPLHNLESTGLVSSRKAGGVRIFSPTEAGVRVISDLMRVEKTVDASPVLAAAE
jgi:hypothetical protein